jgi:hypothetical protein
MPKARVSSTAREPPPPEAVLRQLRIPFVRRATLVRASSQEEAFVIDVGLAGAFIEHSTPLSVDESLEIRFAWPGSEVPFHARCRVAWWHPEGGSLSSKSLPAGAGLEFVEMSESDRERLRALLLDHCRQEPSVRRFLRLLPEGKRRDDDPTAG